ncbi:MAG: DUF2066 domain-containing protein [Candidatus Polarisedimenticolaceae bacterium]|nr:DUF2066 domain-containing protein [Candidatus Polarisedimenticolaceae bacterium]
MRWSLGVLSLLIVMTVASPAFSAQVSGLYGAEVPAEGQEVNQRNKAIVEAFRQVLVKVTGSREIVQHPQLAGEIRNAPRYVRQYRYRMVTREASLAEPQPEPEAGETAPAPALPVLPRQARMLRVVFDEKAVNRMLRERGVAVWGSRRPATLVWLATERNGRRSLVMPDSDEQLYTTLLDAMDTRGVPILFPLMDLEDQASLRVSDLWGGFSDTLLRASARYGPDAVMTARLVEFEPELWRAGWMLLLDKKEFLWDSEGESLAMTVEAGIHAGMDLLASHYAPSATESSTDAIYLRVAGVDDLYRFARLQKQLSGQDIVEQLSLVFVEPEAVTYALHIRGGQRALEQGISLSRMLVPDRPEEMSDQTLPAPPSEVMVDSGEVLLRYRLQP